MPYSGDAGDMRASRLSSRIASVLTSSGMPAPSSFLRSSSISRVDVVAFAEFLLNGLQLLAQIEFALVLRKLPLHLRLDPAAQFHQFQFARQVAVDFAQPRLAVQLLQQMLPLRVAQSRAALPATKSASRPGSVMFAAFADSSSERLGEAETICWKSAHHVLPQRFDFGRDFRLHLRQSARRGRAGKARWP